VPVAARATGRRVDLIGAALCAAGLFGIVFALIEQPHFGWSSPVIFLPLCAGVVAFAAFLRYESRIAERMLELGLFSRRNFAVGNAETLAMYAGLAVLFFFLTIFLQQVAGYSALESGLTVVPVTLVMFALSKRFGALADRFGPRFFMGAGPLIGAVGILLLLRTGLDTDYMTDLLPALLVFSLGLSLTVAPLVATVLADADESDAGIASAINNAVARVAGLVGVSAVGLVVSKLLVGDTFAANAESVDAFHHAVEICAVLLAAGGVLGAVGIVNPRTPIEARRCSGGQLVGAPQRAAERTSRASATIVEPSPQEA
jgi:predicted MFS family arabinose efflux permease